MNLDFLDLSGKFGIFDQLREANGEELTNEMKDKFLEMIDIERDDRGYALDSEGKIVSYDGIKGMKKANTFLNLTNIHINEIGVCAKDFKYFRRNYCKILNRGKYRRPDIRDYQERAEDELITGDDLVMLFPRQCISGGTYIYVDNKQIKIKDYFDSIRNSFISDNELFLESKVVIDIKKTKGYMCSPNIRYVHKTIPLDKYTILLENGMTLSGSSNHIVITNTFEETSLKDSLNKTLITEYGISKVVECIDNNIKEEFYDIGIDSDDNLYFSDGILSHNSGKTVTVSTYLLHNALFRENITIGVAGNTLKIAKEVISKIKDIYMELPIWLAAGIKTWNKTEIEFENRTKIMGGYAGASTYKGFSLSILYVDETAFIGSSSVQGTMNSEIWTAFQDDTIPALSAVPGSQAIYTSTANGINHFYHMCEGAKQNKISFTKEEIFNIEGQNVNLKKAFKDRNLLPKSIKSIDYIDGEYKIVHSKGVNGFRFLEASWKEVPRYRVDDSLIANDEFKLGVVEKNGELYFQQNYGNSFHGSSDTLISTDALKSIQPSEDEHITFDKLFQGLRTFNDPIAGHHYIVTCDPKKKGTDPAGIQVIDVTKLPFIQVATAQLDEDFMTLPEKLFILGNEYNQAMVVSENNIGESIPATLFYQYEYEGEVFTEKDSNGVYKKEMGFRTKVNTKIQILTLMKKFIESGDLIIQDRKTLDELFNFVKKPNGTYSADGSNTDDLVMSLAITFAPFIDFKNWDNFKGFIEYIERKKEVEEKEDDDFVEFLDLGFSSDLGISEEVTGFTKDLWDNESYNDFGGSFG